MFGGRVVFATPMLWSIGFMITFVLGGMTGVLLAVPPADFVLHNSLFLVAHFHNVIIGGVLFGAFAGYTYWFPKAFGFRLHEGLGKAAFWCWFVGFYLAFMPLYVLGFMGMTRRMQHYDVPAWHPWLLLRALGAAVILAGIGFQVAQLVVSIRQRESLRDVTGDPWNGRSLEWATASPPAAVQFRRPAQCRGRGSLLDRQTGRPPAPQPERRAGLRRDRDAAQQRHGLRLRLLRHLRRLRADLAHLVDGHCRRRVRLRHLRRVRLARPARNTPSPAEEVARIDRVQPRRTQRRAGRHAARRMSTTHPRTGFGDPNLVGHGGPIGRRAHVSHAERDLASKRIISGYGFWIFLLSDIIMFAAFFAAYAVLSGGNRGRAERQGLVRPHERRHRDRLPAAVQLHLRRRQHRRPRP